MPPVADCGRACERGGTDGNLLWQWDVRGEPGADWVSGDDECWFAVLWDAIPDEWGGWRWVWRWGCWVGDCIFVSEAGQVALPGLENERICEAVGCK